MEEGHILSMFLSEFIVSTIIGWMDVSISMYVDDFPFKLSFLSLQQCCQLAIIMTQVVLTTLND